MPAYFQQQSPRGMPWKLFHENTFALVGNQFRRSECQVSSYHFGLYQTVHRKRTKISQKTFIMALRVFQDDPDHTEISKNDQQKENCLQSQS